VAGLSDPSYIRLICWMMTDLPALVEIRSDIFLEDLLGEFIYFRPLLRESKKAFRAKRTRKMKYM